MKLSELIELVGENDGYLFFTADGVKYEIDDLIDDSGDIILLAGFAE